MNIHNPNGRQALVSIDPGRNLGWAVFVFQGHISNINTLPAVWTLRACGLASSAARDISTQAAETRKEVQEKVLRAMWDSGFHPGQPPVSVCELMEYRPDDRRSNAEDLIRVATIGAAVAGMLSPEPNFVTPNTWKAQVPKDIMEKRIFDELTAPEAKVFAAMSVASNLRHNTVDAIGIGLWATGRFARGGVQG